MTGKKKYTQDGWNKLSFFQRHKLVLDHEKNPNLCILDNIVFNSLALKSAKSVHNQLIYQISKGDFVERYKGEIIDIANYKHDCLIEGIEFSIDDFRNLSDNVEEQEDSDIEPVSKPEPVIVKESIDEPVSKPEAVIMKESIDEEQNTVTVEVQVKINNKVPYITKKALQIILDNFVTERKTFKQQLETQRMELEKIKIDLDKANMELSRKTLQCTVYDKLLSYKSK